MKNETPLLTVPSRFSLRKPAFYGILAMVSLLTLAITQSARANLITNGGFETGNFTGWTQSGNTNTTWVWTFGQHSGFYGTFLGPETSEGFLTQDVATTAGGHYVIDFWLADDGGNPSDFRVSWGGTTLFSRTNLPLPFPYTEYTFDVIASSATTALQFGFRNDAAYFHLDDISVTSVPDAGSTLSLLGFASLGLVALRRKLRC